MASPLAVGDRVRVEKGFRGSGAYTVTKGTSADVIKVTPLGADYSHEVEVKLKFVNGIGAGRTMSFYARHLNRLSDDVVAMNDGRPEHRIEVTRQRKASTAVQKPTLPVLPTKHECYGPNHQMGAIVPKGGSMCGNCAFGHSDTDGPHCLNTCWSGTPLDKGGGGGETHLPVMDATTYCCDMWTPIQPKKKG